MASYDSDSSGGEQEFTETNVLLGYTSKDAGGETVSRLGGRPEWLVPEKPPTSAVAKCKACKGLMALLLQLNGELPGKFPGHERRLYLFACRNKACRRRPGAIRAVRGIRISKEAAAAAATEQTAPAREVPKPAPPKTGLGESLFGVRPAASSELANPFSSAGSVANLFTTKSQATAAAATVNPFSISQPAAAATAGSTKAASESAEQPKLQPAADLPKTFAEKLALNNQQTPHGPPPPPEPWPPESEQPTPYPVSWIAEAEYETLDPTPPTPPQATAAMDLDDGSGGGGGGGKEDKEVFESTMDAAFQKFADRVGQNPDQAIRYEHGGQPLLYSKDDMVGRSLAGGGAVGGAAGGGGSAATGMPPCANCGAGRLFEVQMTPHAITELESEDDSLDGMDWGTIIVGVCGRDCQERGVEEGEAGYLEEWAGVQWEELAARR